MLMLVLTRVNEQTDKKSEKRPVDVVRGTQLLRL